MLFKNGKRYEVTDKEVADLKKNYMNKDGILEITWDVNRGTVNPTKALSPAGPFMTREQLSEFPPSFQIPTQSQIKDDNGNTVVWNYATETFVNDKTGATRYLPKVIPMRNSLPVEDMELAYYLVNCSPFLGNGKIGKELLEKDKNYVPDLRIVVAKDEAKALLEDEEAQDDARLLIRKDASIDDIRNIAASYGIMGSMDEDEAVLRSKLLQLVKYDPTNVDPFVHFKSFLTKYKEMSKSDEISASVQILLDAKQIKYDTKSHTWFDVKADGSNGSKIITLKANQSTNAVGHLKKAAEKQSKIGKQIKDMALTLKESKD